MQVNNACATGSSALVLARQLIEGGAVHHCSIRWHCRHLQYELDY